MISASLASDSFVGRREELAILDDELDRASRESARFLSIEGEAGIGKSRLVHEFVASVGPRVTVVSGQCSEQVRSPYLPVAALLAHVETREDKAAFFARAVRTLARDSLRKPVVAIVEDLQWADSATLELLAYLMQHLGSARVLFIVTLRAEDAAHNPPLSAFRYQAARNRATTVALRGLRRNDVRRLVSDVAGKRGKTVDPETVAQIEALSEGNPLFTEELVHIAVESGTLNLAMHMPLSIQAMLGERLAPLSEKDRGILIRAAIVGQRFDAAFLARIVEAPLQDVLEVVQRAVAAGILIVSRHAYTEFRFRHAMIRQALADQLILGLAAPLHVRIAREIQAAPDAGERVAELAYHWSAARVTEQARCYNERAALAAWNVYAYRDAIGFYSMALHWEYPPGPARAAVYEHLGTLLYIEGFGEEPATWFERCREEYARLGDAAGTSHALLRLTDQYWVDARTSKSLEAAAAAAKMLESLGRPKMLAEARLSLARFSITLGDAQAARAHLESAGLLRDAFDATLEASFYEVRAEMHVALGEAARALADCRAASRLAQSTGVSELIAQVENNFALVASDLGETALAVERHEIALAEARRTSMMWRVAYSALNYAHTLVLQGELQRARRLVWEATQSGVTTATLKTKAAAIGIPLALLLNDRQLLDACADELAMALATRSQEIQRIGAVAAAFAELRFAQGAPSEASRLLAGAISAIPRAHRCWNLFVQAALHGSRPDRAAVRSILAASTARPRVLRAIRLLFEAIASLGERPGWAARAARIAARGFSRIGWSLYEALALETAGSQRQAMERHRAMGNVRDAERLRNTLGSPPPSTLLLSARQSEIARLVAEGETNRSIAARLHISEHTVEHHLTTIFTRLGIRSRSALAARVTSWENE